MLRWSAENSHYTFNPASIADTTQATGIPGGEALIALVDATMLGTEGEREQARTDLLSELGPQGLISAASTYGNFEMMNRIAEGTGVRASDAGYASSANWREQLGLDRFSKGYE